MARKNRDEGGGGESWMNTYADMVTLLLTFFVMLFSMSSVNEEKWEMLIAAFTSHSGTETTQVVLTPLGEGDQIGANQGTPDPSAIDPSKEIPTEIDELFQYLQNYVAQNKMEGSVEIMQGDGTVLIRFRNNILFSGDSDVLKASSYGVLDFLGRCLKGVEDQIMLINISGHTAALPWNDNYEVNDRMLSLRRAGNVAIYFENNIHLDPKKILPLGYGKNFPIAENDTEEGRQQNRRVDMMVVSNQSGLSDREILEQLLQGTFDPKKYPEIGNQSDILIPPANDEDN